MTTDPSSDVLERLEDEAMRLHGRGIERGCVDSSLAGNLALEAIALIEARDATIKRLSAERMQLRNALQQSELQLEYLDERFPTGTTPAVLARIRAALSNTAENG